MFSEVCCSVWRRAVLLKINQLYLNTVPQAHLIFGKRMKKKHKNTAVLSNLFYFFLIVAVSYSIFFMKIPSISAVQLLLRLPRRIRMSLMGKVRSRLEC